MLLKGTVNVVWIFTSFLAGEGSPYMMWILVGVSPSGSVVANAP